MRFYFNIQLWIWFSWELAEPPYPNTMYTSWMSQESALIQLFIHLFTLSIYMEQLIYAMDWEISGGRDQESLAMDSALKELGLEDLYTKNLMQRTKLASLICISLQVFLTQQSSYQLRWNFSKRNCHLRVSYLSEWWQQVPWGQILVLRSLE